MDRAVAAREERVMDKKKVTIGVVAVLLIALGAAWAMSYFHRTDPAIAELQQLRDQMRAAPEADRQGFRDQFRQKIEGLTDAQRQEFFQSNRGQFRQDMQKRMNEFFAMSPADQKKRLDEIIDRNLKRQKERQAQVAAGQGGAGGGGAAGGGGRGGRQNMTDGQREQARKERLDNSSPMERAQGDKFRQMMSDRMQQRGIPQTAGGGGGGPWMGGRG
jgi:hypothetical protein